MINLKNYTNKEKQIIVCKQILTTTCEFEDKTIYDYKFEDFSNAVLFIHCSPDEYSGWKQICRNRFDILEILYKVYKSDYDWNTLEEFYNWGIYDEEELE